MTARGAHVPCPRCAHIDKPVGHCAQPAGAAGTQYGHRVCVSDVCLTGIPLTGFRWGKRYYSQQIGDPLVLNWRRLVYFRKYRYALFATSVDKCRRSAARLGQRGPDRHDVPRPAYGHHGKALCARCDGSDCSSPGTRNTTTSRGRTTLPCSTTACCSACGRRATRLAAGSRCVTIPPFPCKKYRRQCFYSTYAYHQPLFASFAGGGGAFFLEAASTMELRNAGIAFDTAQLTTVRGIEPFQSSKYNMANSQWPFADVSQRQRTPHTSVRALTSFSGCGRMAIKERSCSTRTLPDTSGTELPSMPLLMSTCMLSRVVRCR